MHSRCVPCLRTVSASVRQARSIVCLRLYRLAHAHCIEYPQVPAAALMAAVAIASEPGRAGRASAEPDNLPDDLDLHALMNTLMCR